MKPAPTAGTVEVIKGTRIVAKVSVGPTGRFTVDLPAGSYLVKGQSIQWRGAGRCAIGHLLQVDDGDVIFADVDCHFVGAAPG